MGRSMTAGPLLGCWRVALPGLDQVGDLDGVVCEDAQAAPGLGAGQVIEAGAVEAVATLEVGDASLAAGAPLDQAAEAAAVLVLAAGLGGLALAGNHHGAHAEVGQFLVDLGLAVAPIGGDRARCSPGQGLIRPMAGASSGASAGLPRCTPWSSTIPWVFPPPGPCSRTRPVCRAGPWRSGGRPRRAGTPAGSPRPGSPRPAGCGSGPPLEWPGPTSPPGHRSPRPAAPGCPHRGGQHGGGHWPAPCWPR